MYERRFSIGLCHPASARCSPETSAFAHEATTKLIKVRRQFWDWVCCAAEMRTARGYGRGGATMILPGETEAGSAGTQPC